MSEEQARKLVDDWLARYPEVNENIMAPEKVGLIKAIAVALTAREDDLNSVDMGGGDGTERLCLVLYGRRAEPRDYLGASNARMLYDAADRLLSRAKEIHALRAALTASEACCGHDTQQAMADERDGRAP